MKTKTGSCNSWHVSRCTLDIEKGSRRNEVVKRFFTPPFERHEAASRAVSHPVPGRIAMEHGRPMMKESLESGTRASRATRAKYFSSESCKCAAQCLFARFDFRRRKEIIRDLADATFKVAYISCIYNVCRSILDLDLEIIYNLYFYNLYIYNL